MAAALTSGNMSPELLKVVERAQREPEGRFHSLAHLIDVPALAGAYHRLRKDASAGADGVTKETYGKELDANLESLHERLRSKHSRHQPLRRAHIPKGQGRRRPIGISVLEDKIVQGAVREVLEAIYEQDFLDCSYGFRPGRSAHDAVRALDRAAYQGKVSWILEADIVSFFDSLDRTKLKEMLQERLAPVLLQLRTQFTASTLIAQIKEQQKQGYVLAFAESGGEIVGVAGFVVGTKLAWGRHIYVDDLVTAERCRSAGVGSALIEWLKAYGRDSGCDQIHLGSGVQRFAAHQF